MKNPAAVAMGSMRSPRKTAAAQKNGQLGGRPTLTKLERAQNRVNRSAKLSAHADTIWSDWNNMDDHVYWLLTATIAQIVDWAETVEAE